MMLIGWVVNLSVKTMPTKKELLDEWTPVQQYRVRVRVQPVGTAWVPTLFLPGYRTEERKEQTDQYRMQEQN